MSTDSWTNVANHSTNIDFAVCHFNYNEDARCLRSSEAVFVVNKTNNKNYQYKGMSAYYNYYYFYMTSKCCRAVNCIAIDFLWKRTKLLLSLLLLFFVYFMFRLKYKTIHKMRKLAHMHGDCTICLPLTRFVSWQNCKQFASNWSLQFMYLIG